MSTIQIIRKRLGMSQVEFARSIGVTQGNICHIEQGRQEVMPRLARKIIAVAAERGEVVTFDDIYSDHQEAA